MSRWTNVLTIAFLFMLTGAPAMAEEAGAGGQPGGAAVAQTPGPHVEILAGTAIGAGIVLLGGAYGIGRIGASAVESMARQPEVAGRIQTGMIISAALIEGVTFFGLIVCLLTLFF